ncbi:hypothetical protein B566_EDAN014868 [Ephemera danica]|nr:hypothetical protein B566_EDAN014868 [Ephemera danica]
MIARHSALKDIISLYSTWLAGSPTPREEQGCLFHFSQSLWEYAVVTCGLKASYSNDEEIRRRSGEKDYMTMGLQNENAATSKYLQVRKEYQCVDCGLLINPGIPCLGASPDKVVLDHNGDIVGLLEINTLKEDLRQINFKRGYEVKSKPVEQIRHPNSTNLNHILQPFLFNLIDSTVLPSLHLYESDTQRTSTPHESSDQTDCRLHTISDKIRKGFFYVHASHSLEVIYTGIKV